MSISNEAFFTGMADVVVRIAGGTTTPSDGIIELTDLATEWTGLVPEDGIGPAVAAKVTRFTDLAATRDGDISAWAQGTADAVITSPAGQPAPGYYPIRIQGGATVWIPSPLHIIGATLRGYKGWSPVLISIQDGTRRVLRVIDWVGGEGTKPATGYVGSGGLVANVADGVDFFSSITTQITAINAAAAAAAASEAAAAASAASALTSKNAAATSETAASGSAAAAAASQADASASKTAAAASATAAAGSASAAAADRTAVAADKATVAADKTAAAASATAAAESEAAAAASATDAAETVAETQSALVQLATSLIQTQTIVVEHHAFA
ncbi:hypothetical protein CPT_Sansa44 [Caulobacter phage Sansa]|uniref:Tail fiber protein n=1 Tax=Caulobacter phage Sansa TaxID=1675600 RepID=A0A0K1LMM9_9CAUD|nr:tail fiber protein [Caulobacter phage Sansa]AKU43448.1 hypothetical protein CPT_Sansa44 [Caulobacter phage Sansa]